LPSIDPFIPTNKTNFNFVVFVEDHLDISIFVILIIGLALLILGALGFVFLRNRQQKTKKKKLKKKLLSNYQEDEFSKFLGINATVEDKRELTEKEKKRN